MSKAHQTYRHAIGHLSDKPLLPLRARKHTRLRFAKPSVAIACHPVINGVSDGAGNDFENRQESPPASDSPHNFQRCIRTGENARAIHEYHGVKVFFGKTKLLQEHLPGIGLKSRKLENAFSVAFQYPLHGGIAEIAHAIEQQHGRFNV